MAWDRPKQPAYGIFSIKLWFWQFKSRRPMFKEAFAR